MKASLQRTMRGRWLIFSSVGLMGIAVQMTCLIVLTRALGINYLTATALAVEAAILHNFWWHVRWTWSDRQARPREIVRRLVRFHATTGIVSIGGNLVLTATLVRLGVHYVEANLIAVTACSAANFMLAHFKVFAPAIAAAMVIATSSLVFATDLPTPAALEFDRYVRLTEQQLDEQRDGKVAFLGMDRLGRAEQSAMQARMRRGEIVTTRLRCSGVTASGVMCHQWRATMLLPETRLDRIISLMQAYENYRHVYSPAVRQSRTVHRDGDRFNVSLQLFMKKIVAVVLNTESTVTYIPVSPTRVQVRSESTRIAEVKNPGERDEREEPVGHDNGFLWRFNNYCSLEERQEGTYVQCESLSLTRDTPSGLGWVIGPFVTSIPRESLEFTMEAMRRAIDPS